MAESAGKPEPLVPWYTRAAWAIWSWVTWPTQTYEMKRRGFRQTDWLTWETGPPGD